MVETIENNNEEDNRVVEETANKLVVKHRDYLIKKDKNKRKFKIISIISVVLTVILIITFAIISLINRMNTNVYKNVYLFKDNISNMSLQELEGFLERKTNEIEKNLTIDIHHNGKEIYSLKSEDIDFTIDTEKTITKIMDFGRKDNIFKDNFKIIKAYFLKEYIYPDFVYSEEKLDEVIKNIDSSIEGRYSNDSFNIDEKTHILIITKGKTGNSIDYELTKKDLIRLLSKINITNYNLNVIEKLPLKINVEELNKEVSREPQNAYIDNESKPPKFINEVHGYKLDLQKLNEILDKEENKKEGATVEFPLLVLEPEIKLTDLTYNLFNDKLAGYTTYFDSSQKARGRNIEIALSKLNGAVIMPGQVFSYYGRVGEINYAKGYLDAATFKGGLIVNEVGGGVCQTSSTLYNTALMANLQITERYQHGLPVAYVPPSRDATIYGKIIDFKFKNTRNYPIKIVTNFSSAGSMNISIYGTKEKVEYDIILSSKVLQYTPFTTKYTYDSNLEEGKTVVINKGVNGFVSEGYITKKLNGKIVESRLLSKDIYKSQQQLVNIGTKKVKKDTNSEPNIY